jgi:hypothetical protein
LNNSRLTQTKFKMTLCLIGIILPHRCWFGSKSQFEKCWSLWWLTWGRNRRHSKVSWAKRYAGQPSLKRLDESNIIWFLPVWPYQRISCCPWIARSPSQPEVFFRLEEWRRVIRLRHLRGPQQISVLIFMVLVSGCAVWWYSPWCEISCIHPRLYLGLETRRSPYRCRIDR